MASIGMATIRDIWEAPSRGITPGRAHKASLSVEGPTGPPPQPADAGGTHKARETRVVAWERLVIGRAQAKQSMGKSGAQPSSLPSTVTGLLRHR